MAAHPGGPGWHWTCACIAPWVSVLNGDNGWWLGMEL